MTIFWPTPGTCELCVLNRWVFDFWVRSTPLRGLEEECLSICLFDRHLFWKKSLGQAKKVEELSGLPCTCPQISLTELSTNKQRTGPGIDHYVTHRDKLYQSKIGNAQFITQPLDKCATLSCFQHSANVPEHKQTQASSVSIVQKVLSTEQKARLSLCYAQLGRRIEICPEDCVWQGGPPADLQSHVPTAWMCRARWTLVGRLLLHLCPILFFIFNKRGLTTAHCTHTVQGKYLATVSRSTKFNPFMPDLFSLVSLSS